MEFLIAFVLLGGVQIVFACTCDPVIDHPQRQFCTSSVVIYGKVREVITPVLPTENINYRMKVYKKYKGRTSRKIVVTKSNSVAGCGVPDLQRNEKYLMTANANYDGTYSIDPCSLVINRRDHSRKYKKFKKMYSSRSRKSYPGRKEVNCNTCQIQYCGLNGNCGMIPPPLTTCTYFGDLAQIQCYNGLRCVPTDSSGVSCMWSSSSCESPAAVYTPPIDVFTPTVDVQQAIGLQSPIGVKPPFGAQPHIGAEPPFGAQPHIGVEPHFGAQPTIDVQPASIGVEPPFGAEPPIAVEPHYGAQAPIAVQPPVVDSLRGSLSRI